jgi:hypothetical protein
MYIEHDFELSFVHPIQKPETPLCDLETKVFYVFTRLEILEGSVTIDILRFHEKMSGPCVNDLIEFCNPQLWQEMVLEAEIYIKNIYLEARD